MKSTTIRLRKHDTSHNELFALLNWQIPSLTSRTICLVPKAQHGTVESHLNLESFLLESLKDLPYTSPKSKHLWPLQDWGTGDVAPTFSVRYLSGGLGRAALEFGPTQLQIQAWTLEFRDCLASASPDIGRKLIRTVSRISGRIKGEDATCTW